MSDDTIYRQAAINALREHRALYCDNTPDTFSKLSYAEKCRVDELDTAIATLINLPSAQPEPLTVTIDYEPSKDVYDRLKQAMRDAPILLLPPAQPAPRWIPCSERLPEKEEMYLVSGDSEIWMCEFIRIGFTRGWSNPANCPVVKAWMPLPEPYKEENR